MDRRQKRTRNAILRAFSTLLERKRYEQISVQDIIEKADVGRSTFYAHFETKDALLKTLCDEVFEHIFEGETCEYPVNTGDLSETLAHILWHLRQRKGDVKGLLGSESGGLFQQYLKENLHVLFQRRQEAFHANVPEDFLLHHLVGAFSETVSWWVKRDMEDEPAKVAAYFMEVVETHET